MSASSLSANFQPGQEPLDIYDGGITLGLWQDDPAQRMALEALDRVHLALIASTPDSLFERVLSRFAKPKTVAGVYLWGGVGRGKTFLMDVFYFSLPFEQKKRVHFHHFMQQVHLELARMQGTSAPLESIADRWAQSARVLCFDEFFVTDIGDAMLLSGLLAALFARGVTLVATSNVVPNRLYEGGLQRARFLPAIALLEKHCLTIELAARQDYRLRALTRAAIYHTPHTLDVEKQFLQRLQDLSSVGTQLKPELDINGRKLRARASAGTVVWFEFTELCESARSAEDYIEIAREFSTVLLSNVPILGLSGEDSARRFMFLVDEFYDRKIKLILSAASEPDALYQGHKFNQEFQRTASRLMEMRTENYLSQMKR